MSILQQLAQTSMKRVSSCHIPLRLTTSPNKYGENTLLVRTPNLVWCCSLFHIRGGDSRGNLSKQNVRASEEARCKDKKTF